MPGAPKRKSSKKNSFVSLEDDDEEKVIPKTQKSTPSSSRRPSRASSQRQQQQGLNNGSSNTPAAAAAAAVSRRASRAPSGSPSEDAANTTPQAAPAAFPRRSSRAPSQKQLGDAETTVKAPVAPTSARRSSRKSSSRRQESNQSDDAGAMEAQVTPSPRSSRNVSADDADELEARAARARRASRHASSARRQASTPADDADAMEAQVTPAPALTNSTRSSSSRQVQEREPSRRGAAPQSQKKEAPPQAPKEMNKDFKDVATTGKWGAIGKREKYIAGGLVLVVLIGVAIAVTVVLTNDDSGGGGGPTGTPAPTVAPTSRPVSSPEEQSVALRTAAAENTFLQESQLPTDLASYQGQASNTTASPQVRAASWILLEDERREDHTGNFFLTRYALAVLYYALEGNGWNNRNNWLTDADTCTWYGVECDLRQTSVQLLDLSKNNLVGGPFPSEINLLQDLAGLWLTENQLTGELPQLAIGSIPRLTILYVDNNKFTGSITTDLRANGVLDTLFIQENDFTGEFPFAFCPRPGQPPPLVEFGLDCEELNCFCCLPNAELGINYCY